MAKRIGLIGCGSLGYPLAWYIGQLGFDELHVHDLDREKAAALKRRMATACPTLRVEDHVDTDQLDVVLLALGGPATAAFVTDPRNHALFKGQRVFVSLGRPSYDDLLAHRALHDHLADRGISLLFGFGLEPGLVEVLLHHAASTAAAGTVASLEAVCGGVPQHPSPPLNYDLLFGDRLPSLNRKALFKVDGQPGFCRRFDAKANRFVEGVGLLEVYHDGLSPHLLASPPLQPIPTVTQQTARWPGFFDCVRVLLDLGLLDEGTQPGDGASPCELTHAILRRNGRLLQHRPDISFAEVVARLHSGERTVTSIVSTYDERAQLTGMAQMTSFTAAYAARQVVDRPAPCRPGVTLSHEFFDSDNTGRLLEAFRRHVQCTVKTTVERMN